MIQANIKITYMAACNTKAPVYLTHVSIFLVLQKQKYLRGCSRPLNFGLLDASRSPISK
jgi:hypothetical protein